MLVGAVSVMRLSNVVENANVVDLPITVSISETDTTPGGDQPNYQSGYLLPTVQYDMRISYYTEEALDQAAIIVEITKTGIWIGDITMSWIDGVPTWQLMTWTDNGDSLRGTLGFVGTQNADSTVGYYASIGFNTEGDYGFKVWVEGIVV